MKKDKNEDKDKGIQSEAAQKSETFSDDPMTPVPLDRRQKWITPAIINGGLEFSVPVMMIGATLIGSFGLKGMIPVVLIAFLCITWVGNSVCGFIGAKTGLPSAVIARQSFGDKQAKFIIALVMGTISMGWWSIQTSVTGNALCAILGIDYTVSKGLWAIITILVGLLFALPSIIGYSSMKWTDFIAVPAGLLLCVIGIYLAFRNYGGATIWRFEGDRSMSFAAGITLILGLNISQFVISSDYTRYARPKVLDNVLIPWGIIAVGVPLVFVGAVMAVGMGTPDIVAVMQNLGFPVWGFLVLWLASWTSQLVNNYSMGLCYSSILNVNSNKGRAVVTFAGTLIAIALCLAGILDLFTDLLTIAGLCYPAIAGVMFVDFFARRQKWEDKIGWNVTATFSMIVGIFVGYLTAYVVPLGIPALQSLAVTCLFYYFAMKLKARVAPDQFTEGYL
jgi:cytosine permease